MADHVKAEHSGLKHKVLNFIQDHKFFSILIAGGVLGGVYFGYSALTASATPVRYGVTQAQKGTLIVTVSGSGQVLASSQVDINPKVSGTITAVLVKEGDQVKSGQVIAKLDATDADKAVRDAKLNLASAQVALKKLTEPPDNLSLVQAQNDYASAQRALKLLTDPPDAYTLTQAQNDVDTAQRNLQQAQTSSTQQTTNDSQTLQNSLDTAYNTASNAFVDAPQAITDLEAVKTTNNSTDNLSAYRTVLGQNSPYVDNFANAYDNTINTYYSTFAEYKATSRDANTDTLIKLIDDTQLMEKTLSIELENARDIFDAISSRVDYSTLYLSSLIDVLKPKIESDITTVNKDLNDLQTEKDNLTTLTENDPINTQKSLDAISSAQETLKEKQQYLAQLLQGPKAEDVSNAQDNVAKALAALQKLKQGADALDVQNQKLTVQQKQNALTDAQANLAKYSVTAPFDGIVAKVTAVNGGSALNGQNSSSSTNVATLISSGLLAQVSLNEVDAAKVVLDDKATLTFDAVPDVSITGKVVQIDTIGTSTQGVVTYNTRVAFDTQDARIKPGMSVTAAIITQVDQDVLLVPNGAVKTQGGGSSYVQTFDSSLVTPSATDSTTGTVVSLAPPQRVSVQTSTSNDTNTEITGGLQEGQFVVTQTFSASAAAAAATTTAGAGGGAGGGAIRIPGLGGGGFGGGGRAGG